MIFLKGPTRMEELDFGDGSWDECGSLVRTTLTSIHRDINGNGKPGLKEDMSTLLAYGRATQFWAKGIFGLLLALGAMATIFAAYFESHLTR
jgi:hypothetical protein